MTVEVMIEIEKKVGQLIGVVYGNNKVYVELYGTIAVKTVIFIFKCKTEKPKLILQKDKITHQLNLTFESNSVKFVGLKKLDVWFITSILKSFAPSHIKINGRSDPYFEQIGKILLDILPKEFISKFNKMLDKEIKKLLNNKEKVKSIEARLAKKKMNNKMKVQNALKNYFVRHNKVLDEELVLQVWRESIVGMVMNE